MPEPPHHRFAHQAMRTQFELVVADPLDAHAARAIAEELFAEIDAVEARLSAFLPTADIHRINQAAGARKVVVDPRVLDVLATTRALVAETDGAFDVTVGPLLALLRAPQPPEAAELDHARSLIGFDRQVRLDERDSTVMLTGAGARLDMGGLGKGHALDRAAALLDELGVEHALLHAGTSSVVTRGGADAGAGGWSTALARPPDLPGPSPLALAHLGAGQASLSVSAPHGRPLRWPDGQTGHLVDPRTGTPAAGARLAAVVHDSGTIAEAWSTALVCLGPKGLARLQAQRPESSALVVDSAGALHTLGDAFALDRSPPFACPGPIG